MPLTTYGDIGADTAGWLSAEMLKRAQPYLCIDKYSQTRPLPKNQTDVARFHRFEALDSTPNALVEGVTPAGKKVTRTELTVTMAQYGDLITVSDQVIDMKEDPVLRENTAVLGEQAAQMIERVKFNILRGGTNVFFSNGALRTSVNTPPTRTTIRAVTKALQRQNARMLSQVLSSSPRYDTHNVEPSYFALSHPDLESDIRDMTGFISSAQYGSIKAEENEIGSVEHVRFIKSTIFASWPDGGGATGAMESTTGVSADVYPIIVLGRDAFATVPLKGAGSLTPMVVNAKPSDSDPLAQRTHISWKHYMTALILNDLFMARIECAATA